MDRFERALKVWARRPTLTPPEQASQRVLDAARQRRRRALTRRTLLATAAVLAVVVTLAIRRDPAVPEATPTAAARLEPARLGEGEVLIWLDAETPLYMTFEAPQAHRGGLP